MKPYLSFTVEQLGPDRFIATAALSATHGGQDLIYCVPADTRIAATQRLKGFLRRLRRALIEIEPPGGNE
jgi:hypothetical protein